MSAPAAICASLVDVRNIAAHKCVRLEIHVPVEQAALVMQAFGWPTMADPVSVAIARLDMTKASAPEPEKKRAPFAELPIAQQAALLCDRNDFRRFLRWKGWNALSVEGAATALREFCSVSSRSELSTNHIAAGKFQTLTHEFEDWLKTPL
jgi:hypothetical protein